MDKLFLQSYGGQTIQQSIGMKQNYRIDSLILAIEQALGAKADTECLEAERVVRAVEALEREVNNGGYEQFFINSSREFTSFITFGLDLPTLAMII